MGYVARLVSGPTGPTAGPGKTGRSSLRRSVLTSCVPFSYEHWFTDGELGGLKWGQATVQVSRPSAELPGGRRYKVVARGVAARWYAPVASVTGFPPPHPLTHFDIRPNHSRRCGATQTQMPREVRHPVASGVIRCGSEQVPLSGLEPTVRNAEEIREKLNHTTPSGAESGALSDSLSPALSVLMKLTAGLTAEERGTLARTLQAAAGESIRSGG